MKFYLPTINNAQGYPVEHFATVKARDEAFDKMKNVKESQKGAVHFEIKGVDSLEELIKVIVK